MNSQLEQLPILLIQNSFRILSSEQNEHSDHSDDNHGQHGDEHSAHIAQENLVVLFMFVSLAFGGVVRVFCNKYQIPYTLVIFVTGIFLGRFPLIFGDLMYQSIQIIIQINPAGLCQIFLPIIAYQGAFNVDWNIFYKQSMQIFTLGFVCLFLNSCLISFTIKSVLMYEDDYYTWAGAFMLGSILAMQDPTTIQSLLKGLNTSKQFNALVENESLVSFAIACTFFNCGMYLLETHHPTSYGIIYLFLSNIIGGILLGIVIGIFSSFCLKKMFNNEIQVVNITLIMSYLAYFLAESYLSYYGLQFSGVMALVSLGLFMSKLGKTRINGHFLQFVEDFWAYVIWFAITIIVILGGMIIGYFLIRTENEYIRQYDMYNIVTLYVMMQVSRIVSMYLFHQGLFYYGYGFSKNEFAVLMMGSCKGSLTVVFALVVYVDPYFDRQFKDIFLFHIASMTILSMLINSPLFKILARLSGIEVQNTMKDRSFSQFLLNLTEECEEKCDELMDSKYLANTDWVKVEEYAGIHQLKKVQQEMENEILANEQIQSLREKNQSMSSRKNSGIQIDNLQKKLQSEARSNYLMIFKKVIFEIYEHNLCTGDTYALILQALDLDLDNLDRPLDNWKTIKNTFYSPSTINMMMNMNEYYMIGGYIKNSVFSQISFSYDVVSTYIKAIEETDDIFALINIDQNIVQMIENESESNKSLAEQYIHGYLNLSFPEITRSMQTKKAAFSIILHQKQMIEDHFEKGSLEIKEYNQVKSLLDDKLLDLMQLVPTWQRDTIDSILDDIPIFQFFSKEKIAHLIDSSVERTFERNYQIIREGQTAQHFYLILRGSGTVYSIENPQFKESFGVGSLINLSNIITPTGKYLNSFVSDSLILVRQFDIFPFQALIKQNSDFEKYVWSSSLFQFTRIFKSLGPMYMCQQLDVSKVVGYSQINKYKPGQIMDFSCGGIFLQGTAKVFSNEFSYNPQRYQFLQDYYFNAESKDKNLCSKLQNFKDELINQNQKCETVSFITYYPPHSNCRLFALENCLVLSFMNENYINELMNHKDDIRQSRLQSRRSSFQDISKQNSELKPILKQVNISNHSNK